MDVTAKHKHCLVQIFSWLRTHFLQPLQPSLVLLFVVTNLKDIAGEKLIVSTQSGLHLCHYDKGWNIKTTNSIRAGCKHGWFCVKSNEMVQWKCKIFKHKWIYSIGTSVLHSNKSIRSKNKAIIVQQGSKNKISSRRILKKLKMWGIRWTGKIPDCGGEKKKRYSCDDGVFCCVEDARKIRQE